MNRTGRWTECVDGLARHGCRIDPKVAKALIDRRVAVSCRRHVRIPVRKDVAARARLVHASRVVVAMIRIGHSPRQPIGARSERRQPGRWRRRGGRWWCARAEAIRGTCGWTDRGDQIMRRRARLPHVAEPCVDRALAKAGRIGHRPVRHYPRAGAILAATVAVSGRGRRIQVQMVRARRVRGRRWQRRWAVRVMVVGVMGICLRPRIETRDMSSTRR